MPKRKIIAMTGTRADYGIYRPVFKAIAASPSFSLSLLVTGMHLRKEFGHTVDEIEADGFPIAAKIDSLTGDDSPGAMAQYIARTLAESVKILEREKPDLVFLLGDRGEQLACAIAATELGIPIAHLHGGEQTGTVDDMMRHAITQMATMHLTSAEPHSERVKQMKGSSEHVHTVGAPALDVIRTFTPTSKNNLCAEFCLDPAKLTLLFVQHPDTLDSRAPEEQLKPSLQALESFDGNLMMIGANGDAGGRAMNAMLQEFAKKPGRAFAISVPHEAFLSWEACADVLVGNSSSGIIEAASFHLPVVNIGDRQKGRTRSGNVLDVTYNADAITKAIEKALREEKFRTRLRSCTNVYGDGHAAERIVVVFHAMLSVS